MCVCKLNVTIHKIKTETLTRLQKCWCQQCQLHIKYLKKRLERVIFVKFLH